MDGLDLKGIVFIPKRQKYRVLLTRRNVEYVIGHYIDIIDAIEARDKFLEDYSKQDFYDVNEPPKYTREWYNYKHKKQMADFAVKYSSDKAKFIVIPDTQEWSTTPPRQQVF